MAKDDHNLLDILKCELKFLEDGGYGRSVRTPWKATSIFQDSFTCINFQDPARSRPCSECLLMAFVPPERGAEDVPCHHIRLNEAGDTVASLELSRDEHGLEDSVAGWLRGTIERLEKARG